LQFWQGLKSQALLVEVVAVVVLAGAEKSSSINQNNNNNNKNSNNNYIHVRSIYLSAQVVFQDSGSVRAGLKGPIAFS
jgi:hypothetical protein